MGDIVMEDGDYSLLKDLRLEIDGEERTFALCFWVYLMKSTTFPATILRQVRSDIKDSAPFLILKESKKIMLFSCNEALDPGNCTSWTQVPYASADIEFPLEKWVHVGCEVSTDSVRLYINGEIVGEESLSSYLINESNSNGVNRATLVSIDGNNDGIQGFVHNAKVLALSSSIKDYYDKDPPLQLSIDSSSAYEIEEDIDGVWSIVGGKASCRRNFSFDVILSDAFGYPANKELEVVASLLYADSGAPVEKPDDAEAPLLTSYDGIEFASSDRPSRLLHGRASFKLKISQLSSTCDNRLFRIRFDIPKIGTWPFFRASSLPIRCISRARSTRLSYLTSRYPPSAVPPRGRSQSLGLDNELPEVLQNGHEAKLTPPSKRVKPGQEKSSLTSKADTAMDQREEEYYSHARTNSQVENAFGTSLERRSENFEETDNLPSDSESTEAKNSNFKSLPRSRNRISDLIIFKYCLGGLTDRAYLLKDLATSASDQDLVEFAQQVSLYSGCSHHWHQIVITKKLIEDGTEAWNMISQNSNLVHWENVVLEIEMQFMKIACCSTRSLSHQDSEILRKIAGCGEYLAQENFEKLWRWLYPVAFTLSRAWINATWVSTSPKWIEGFITKEEAEISLHGPRGLQDPGTFVLRFPTSRSWPHPDAGSLIVTYVGSDYTIHHKLVSVDYIYSCGEKGRNAKPLHDMLLDEAELSRLGRILRSP